MGESEVAETKHVKLLAVDRMRDEVGTVNMQLANRSEDAWADKPTAILKGGEIW